MPLGPAEAAELANLIFDQADGKPLSDEVRNRLAARAGALKLQTLTPFAGSLERDPVHHSVYYLAVDGTAGGMDGVKTPLLLHMALAAAPTSSIYYKPLLIGRMRRPNGAEMVINAIPFGPGDGHSLETFAGRINPAFYPQAQGARTTITVDEGYPAAFDTFRAIQKRTGKNFAAVSGDCHTAMWAAIRAGWRTAYSVSRDVTAWAGGVTGLGGQEGCSRYSVAIPASAGGVEEAERVYQQIRAVRAGLKIARAFDLEWEAAGGMSAEFLRGALGKLKERGNLPHGNLPQLVCPGPAGEADLEEMAAVARYFQVTLSFRYGGEPGETVRAVARATAGRVNYRVRTAGEADFVAEHLL